MPNESAPPSKTSTLAACSPSMSLDAEKRSVRREKAALVSRLLSHSWTADDPLPARQAQVADWLEDLDEFSLDMVEDALRQWRQSTNKRPHPFDIRKLCLDSKAARQPALPRPAWVPSWERERAHREPLSEAERAEVAERLADLVASMRRRVASGDAPANGARHGDEPIRRIQREQMEAELAAWRERWAKGEPSAEPVEEFGAG